MNNSAFENYSIKNISAFSENAIPDDAFKFRDLLSVFKKKQASETKEVKSDDLDSKKSGSGVGLGILSGVIGAGAAVSSVLPSLGVGSKSRIAEINAQSAANISSLESQYRLQKEQTQSQIKIVLIATLAIMLIVVVLFAVRKD